MWSAHSKRIRLALGVTAALAVVVLVVSFSHIHREPARNELLRLVPNDATSVVFVDLAELRNSPFLAALYSWAPQVTEDSDYTHFVADTGFNYERDLGQVLIAVSNHGATSNTLVLVDGKFDRMKIESYLARNSAPTSQGQPKVLRIPTKAGDKLVSFAFLSDRRIAIADSENLAAALSASSREPALTEWQTRFDRLAGSPLFAVIRQDPTIPTALALQSPQLAMLIAQLPWITLAGKPTGNLLQVVVEGESPSDAAATQLNDFLQGIQLLAQNGLNDPQLRQRMNPEEREAYLELLKGTLIDKIGRGESKSIRVVFPLTLRILQLGQATSHAPRLPADLSRKTDGNPTSRKDVSPGRKN